MDTSGEAVMCPLGHVGSPSRTTIGTGERDNGYRSATRFSRRWDLLRESKELLLVDGAGHIVPAEIRTPRINAFLDRTLGPVTPKRQ